MTKNSNLSARVSGLLLALLLVLVALAGANAQQSQEASTVIVTAPSTPQTVTATESPTTSFGASPTVRVAATATATASPDRAIVLITVETLDSSVQVAAQKNAADSATVVNAVNNSVSGADASEISTVAYSVSPVYNYTRDPPEITGYRVSQVIRVRIDATSADLGRLVSGVADAATQSGAFVSVTSFDFTLRDPQKLNEEALALATTAALGNARAVAGALGKSLGRVLLVDQSTSGGGPPIPLAVAEAAPQDGSRPSTNIMPGMIQQVASVVLTAATA